MLDSNGTASSPPSRGATAGIGPRSALRAFAISAVASAPSPNGNAITLSSCLEWSKTSISSQTISARSGSPRGSGFGSPSGSTVRTRS